MSQKSSYICGLDLGNNKTCALVCQPGEGGKLEVVGFGVAESKGWRRGVIVSLDSARLSIRKAVEAAEDAAGVSVGAAYVGVGGPHLKGVNSTGGVALGSRSREVTAEDVRRAFEAAKNVTLPPDRMVVNAERQEFLLDSQNGIRNAAGMVGTRLDVHVHVVTGSAIAHENVVTAVNREGITVLDTVYEGLAAAEASLTSDERELGVALLDIGGGSSELIIYHEGSVRYTAVIPVGGDHFTNDVAVGLRTPIPEAEKMKLAWGERDTAQPDAAPLEAPSVGGRPARAVSYEMLKDIIEPRTTELLELAQAELVRSGLERQLGAGIVFSGGGAKLGGLVPLAEHTLGLPVRVARPVGIEKMGEVLPDPAFVTVVGLVIHGNRLRLLRDPRDERLTGKLWGIFRGKGN
ncbi:MAG TPA: cell division protein FtsA [Terriglobia bacterium]|nr:cell division protein FtsA [Terriglobia bacterium]